jgi:tetratricopeptide (TPR) repeat protein
MEENKNNLPALRNIPPDKITKTQIVSLFNTETIRWEYNKMLQGLKSMHITKENLKEEYPEFKAADKFCKSLDTWRKSEANPFNKVDALFLEVYKEITEPILAELTSLKAQVKTAREANAAEIAQAKREQARKDLIVKTLGDFINNCTTYIVTATTDDQVILVEKRIGSEKSKKGFYAEYYQELVDKCEALKSTITAQKKKIQELQKANEAFEQALKASDDSAAAELKEKIELINEQLVENSIRLQEKAFEQSINISQDQVGQPDLNVTKGKTSRWKWKVDDIEFLHKKFPKFTKVVPNDEAIEAYMKEQREAGLFKTQEEEIKVNGITFFKEIYL